MRILIFLFLALAFAQSRNAQCNTTPDAMDDSAEYFGQAISFEALWNDREPDGEALELTVVSHNCGNPPVGRPLGVQVDNGTCASCRPSRGTPPPAR